MGEHYKPGIHINNVLVAGVSTERERLVGEDQS